MKVADKGIEKIVAELINAKVNIDFICSGKDTALMIAAINGNKNICRILIDAKHIKI